MSSRAGRVASDPWVRNRLIAGTLLLLAGRLALSLIRSGPVLVADEIGYLTDARVLAGGLAGQLHMAPFYRGGYSLLIAPLIAIGWSPTLTYHLVLAVNALLTASVFPLLYLLLRRFCSVSPRLSILAAFAGALYPALSVLSQVAMSENALYPLVCLWLIAWAGLLAARESRQAPLWAAGVGGSTGALWAVHNRMIAAVALTIVLLAWLGLRRQLRPAPLASALVVLGGALVGTHALDAYIISHNYGGHAPNEVNERLSALVHQHALRTVLANLLGQAWYLLVSTFGLAAVVIKDAWTALSRKRAGASYPESAPVVPILAGFTGLLLIVSAAAFPERTRPDMLIYGRYVEVTAPALVALGIAGLARRRALAPAQLPLAGFALLTAVVVVIRATASEPDAPNRWNISALPFVTGQLGPAILVGAAIVAVTGAYLLRLASRRSPPYLAGVAALLFLAVIAYGTWNPVRTSQVAVYPAGWTSPERSAERHHIRTVSYDLTNYDAIGLYVVQWFLPHSSVVLFQGRHEPPSSYVLASARWRSSRSGDRSELWSFAGRDETLWRLPPKTEPPSR